jgi:hypothetical protein
MGRPDISGGSAVRWPKIKNPASSQTVDRVGDASLVAVVWYRAAPDSFFWSDCIVADNEMNFLLPTPYEKYISFGRITPS